MVEVRAQRATKPPSPAVGFVARAWRPSHLNQRLGSGCLSACGVSLRSAPGGLPTRPAGTIRWLRCERSEPRNHPRRQVWFRGSGLAALAPQPAREDGCLSACGVSLRSALGGLPTRPAGTIAVVEVRAQRATKPPSPAVRFRGSGLAALAPQPACWGTAAWRRAGSRYGRPWGASLLDQRGRPRWLRCERSEPRNHPHRQSVSWLGPGGPRASTSVWGAAACRRAGSRYGRPWGASLLDQRGRSRWLRCERSEPRNHPHRQSVSWLGPGGPRASTSVWGAAACRRAGSRYGRPWGASLLDQRGRSRWLRCERSEPRSHLPQHSRFRGSGLAALAPQPASGVLLLLGVRGLGG